MNFIIPPRIKMHFNWKLVVNIFYLCSALIVLSSCDKPKVPVSRKASVGDGDGKGRDPNEKPDESSCEQKWLEYLKLHPKGRETIYQETHAISLSKESIQDFKKNNPKDLKYFQFISDEKVSPYEAFGAPSIISQNVIQLTINEVLPEEISWTKVEKKILPEKGTILSELSMKKSTFVDLCLKGFQLNYSERPLSPKPSSVKKVEFIITGEKFNALQEKYIYSKESKSQFRDEMDLWIGSADPYDGVLFKSERHFYTRNAQGIIEHWITKELGGIKDSNKDWIQGEEISLSNE